MRYLAFAKPSTTGEFTDYTARYGALQEEDRQTVRQYLERAFGPSEAAQRNVFGALNYMGMSHLVDMPAIALSSGQTRRSRIAQAIMTRPEMLVLEDPMAGLDASSRVVVDKLLGELNATEAEPRVVLVLRDKGPQDTLSPWVTNVVDIRSGNVWVGTRSQWENRRRVREKEEGDPSAGKPDGSRSSGDPPIVQLRNVSVSYAEGARPVLQNINWEIRPGDKWHLQGANGESSLHTA